jgi:hypothetical protein
VLLEHIVIIEIGSIIQLCKFQNNFDHFRLIRGGEAIVGGAAEDSFYAFEYHLGADWILNMIKGRFKIWMLFRNDYYCLESFSMIHTESLFNSRLNVWPYIRGVISVKIDYLFYLVICIVFVVVGLAIMRNRIQIILICLVTYDINCFMDSHLRMRSTVIFLVTSKDLVV